MPWSSSSLWTSYNAQGRCDMHVRRLDYWMAQTRVDISHNLSIMLPFMERTCTCSPTVKIFTTTGLKYMWQRAEVKKGRGDKHATNGMICIYTSMCTCIYYYTSHVLFWCLYKGIDKAVEATFCSMYSQVNHTCPKIVLHCPCRLMLSQWKEMSSSHASHITLCSAACSKSTGTYIHTLCVYICIYV